MHGRALALGTVVLALSLGPPARAQLAGGVSIPLPRQISSPTARLGGFVLSGPSVESATTTDGANRIVPGATLVVKGRAFGGSASGRAVRFLPDPGNAANRAANFAITRWTDTEIQATVPSRSALGVTDAELATSIGEVWGRIGLFSTATALWVSLRVPLDVVYDSGRVLQVAVDRCAIETDADSDGHQSHICGGDDCDDADGDRYPGNTEVCDAANHDDDCDVGTFGNRDADGDRFYDQACSNTVAGSTTQGSDCDDSRAGVNPTAPEVCNGRDDDCNGVIDEGVTWTFFRDADGDGYGAAATTQHACSPPAGYVLLGTDCNDGNRAVNPGNGGCP